LVLNGASDQYIARSESVVFAGKKNAQVWLVPGATHCAAEVFVRIVPSVVTWLGVQLGANRLRVALVGAVAKAIAPRFERVSAPDSPPVGAATRALA
jgi:esterase FrsA